MVATTLPSLPPDCYPTTGQLVFRLAGTARAGQVLRLNAPKCSIGSGPGCTLRIRARGVAPLHCLILRGPTGTIVRRWAADARLNGESFTDAWLCSGDRLSLGPIELEVVCTGSPLAADQSPSLAPFGSPREDAAKQREAERLLLDDQRQELAELRQQLNEERAQLDVQRQELAERRQHLDAQYLLLDQQRGQFEQQQHASDLQHQQLTEQLHRLEADRRQLDQLRHELDLRAAHTKQSSTELEARLAELDARLAELESEREALQQLRLAEERSEQERNTQTAAEMARLRAQSDQLESQRQTLTEQQAAWNSEYQRQLTLLGAQRTQLLAQQQELEELQATLAEQRQQWQREQESAAETFRQREHDFQAQLADIQKDRDALAHQWSDLAAHERPPVQEDSREASAELNELRDQLARHSHDLHVLEQECSRLRNENEQYQQASLAQREQFDARSAELDRQRQALLEQQQQSQAEQARLTAENERQASDLRAQFDALKTQQESLEQQWQQWRAEQQETEHDLNRQREDLSDERTTLERLREALDTERQQWEREREQWEAERTAAMRDEESRAANDFTADDRAEEDLEFRQPAASAPVSLADVLRRVGASLDTVDEEPEAAQSSTSCPVGEPTTNPTVSSKPAAVAEHEDESIDAYMNRLMERVRSAKSGDAYSAYVPQLSEPAVRADTSLASVSSPMPAEGDQTAEETLETAPSPRRPAPENRTDLSALRELANLSAESALRRHSRRVLIHTMWSKLLVTAVALAAGAGLLWMWRELAAWEAAFYAALVAILVAVCWGVKYLILIRRFLKGHWMHISMTGPRKSTADTNANAAPVANSDSMAGEPEPASRDAF